MADASRKPLHWHKLSQLPHRVKLPVTSDTGVLHAWALKRCGHGGYGEVTVARASDREIAAGGAQFCFPTAEIAREFALAFEHVGAKLAAQ
jgi:hypothetical protein